ncbi:hypothetical protein [Neorhodopirellula pilleata]|uniref:hypothetical protein n=1 Tax=Neorhodopirellula pilleata TaxID=2714738 RepID=UPI0018CE95E3|nr:hypothetical protein [Neorhodopirellula pilleata]
MTFGTIDVALMKKDRASHDIAGLTRLKNKLLRGFLKELLRQRFLLAEARACAEYDECYRKPNDLLCPNCPSKRTVVEWWLNAMCNHTCDLQDN